MPLRLEHPAPFRVDLQSAKRARFTRRKEISVKNLMLSTAMLAILAAPALAQTATTEGDATTTTEATTGAQMGTELFRAEVAPTDILASDFIGMRLYATEAELDADAYDGAQEGWDDIGEVNDLILSQDGSVQAVLVDIGGFLGIGERQVAVQMSSIRFVQDSATADNDRDFFLVLNANRAALEGAPMYSRDGMVDGVTSGAAATGAAVEGEGGLSDTGTAAQAPAEGGTSDTGMAATGTAREPIAREGYAALNREALTSETLTGAEVYDAQDQRIGEVSELVLTPEGQVSDAVLDVGGFLGIGSKRVALPIADVDILQSQDGGAVRVYVPHTKEQLEAMRDYEG